MKINSNRTYYFHCNFCFFVRDLSEVKPLYIFVGSYLGGLTLLVTYLPKFTLRIERNYYYFFNYLSTFFFASELGLRVYCLFFINVWNDHSSWNTQGSGFLLKSVVDVYIKSFHKKLDKKVEKQSISFLVFSF